MGIYFFILVICAGFVFPALLCYANWKYPKLFDNIWKFLGWVVGYSLFSWGYFIAVIWIPYVLGLYSIRGPELAFALFFGWIYLWVTSSPMFLCYGILKMFLMFNPLVRGKSYPCGFYSAQDESLFGRVGYTGCSYPFGFIKFNYDSLEVGRTFLKWEKSYKIYPCDIVNVSVEKRFFFKGICIETTGGKMCRYFYVFPVGDSGEVSLLLRDFLKTHKRDFIF